MTGFGAADGAVGGARVSVEIRSVNHRYFSPSIKLPSSLARWEAEVREALRRAITRGHVTLTARVDRTSDIASLIDEEKFIAYVNRLRALKERYALDGPVDLATLLRLPDVIAAGTDREEGSAAELVGIVERALEELTGVREAEGRRVSTFLDERLAALQAALERIESRAPQRLVEQRDRLRGAVSELADGVRLDEQRLAQEIALLADRLDVQEELSRFRMHLSAFRDAIEADGTDGGGTGGGGVGKRLGFLLQELLREANTTGAKANDAAMASDVLAIKEELERIREQVENVE